MNGDDPLFDPYAYAATQTANTSDDGPVTAHAAEDAPAQAPFEPSFSVSLPKSSWDTITALLGGYPYSQVVGLIDAIKMQTGSQLAEFQLIQALLAAPVVTATQ